MSASNSDIELLITANAAQAKAEMEDLQSQINDLKGASDRASGSGDENSEGGSGIGGMVSKFGHLGRVLRMVNPQLAEAAHGAHLFEAIASPMAAAAVAIVALGVATFKLVEANHEADAADADLAIGLEKLKEEASVAEAGWHAYYAAIASGQDESVAGFDRERAAANELFKLQDDERKKQVGLLQAELDKDKELAAQGLITASSQASWLEKKSIQFANFTGLYIEDQKEIDAANKNNIAYLEMMINNTEKSGIVDARVAGSKIKHVEEETLAHQQLLAAKHEGDIADVLAQVHTNALAQAEAQLAATKFNEKQALEDLNDAEKKNQPERIARLKEILVLDAQLILAETQQITTMKQQEAETKSFGYSMAGVINSQIVPAFGAWENAFASLTGAQKHAETLSIASAQRMVKGILVSLGEKAFADGTYAMLKGGVDIAVGMADKDPTLIAAGEEEMIAGALMADFGLAIGGAGSTIRGGSSGSGGVSVSGGGTGGAGGGTGGGSGGQGGDITVQVVVIGKLDDAGAESLHNQLVDIKRRKNLA